MCGFSVSIHSRSAPFCSEVMQSSTQRSSPVPARNWNRLEGRRLGRSSLPSRLMMTSPLAAGRPARFPRSRGSCCTGRRCRPASWLTAICLVRPAPRRVGAGDDDAVVDAQLQEGVAAGADLREEVLVRHGDLAVLVAALLFVGDLVLDLQRAGAGLDHLLGQQVGRLGIAEAGVDVGDDRHDVGLVVVDRARCSALPSASSPAARAASRSRNMHAQLAGVGLAQEGVEFLDQRRNRGLLVHRLVGQRAEFASAARRPSSPTGRGSGRLVVPKCFLMEIIFCWPMKPCQQPSDWV